jgi:DNA-binding response OmpR family regulator
MRLVSLEKPKGEEKICIVEDDSMIQEMYKIKLEEEGFSVFLAQDGEEGFELIKKELPDVALIDISMPKINGLALIKMLKGEKELLKIPIIIISNLNDEKILKEAGDLDVKFYLVKSLFTPKDVVRIVREVLESKR